MQYAAQRGAAVGRCLTAEVGGFVISTEAYKVCAAEKSIRK